MNTADALTDINLLNEAHDRRQLKISLQSTDLLVEEDEGDDAEAPLFDSFYNDDGN